jgi:hypothetical protein
VAFGGPDGASTREDVGELGVDSSVPWRGPEQTLMTAHGLLWRFDDTAGLPTSYHAYDFVSIALDIAAPAPFELDLTEEDITAGNIQGTVVPVTANERENMAFVRFDTGAPIEVARDSAGPDTFTYLVPTLPNASVTVAASEGLSYYSPFSLAHADGLAAGAAVELTLPGAATPLLPADGATGVTTETPFSFQSGGGAHLVVIRSNSYYTALYIVTADQEFTLPTVAQGAYELYADELFEWWVETHGTQATVDEMAAPEGFLDAFSWNTSYPVGPRRGDGQYTMSRPRHLTTAP